MNWDNFIHKLINTKTQLDDICLSFPGEAEKVPIPPVVKASILMLDKMIKNQGCYNIFVFPEKKVILNAFVLYKLIYNLCMGKIHRDYDPAKFKPGERLKLGKSIVEFVGTEFRNGENCLILASSDLKHYSAPITYLPFFQKANTKRPLNSHRKFYASLQGIKSLIEKKSHGSQLITELAEYKTHINNSIFSMMSIKNAKEMISGYMLDKKRVDDIFLVGQTDNSGSVRNIGVGQLSGIPSIVFAPNLFQIIAASENGHPIQSLIIDISNSNEIQTQLTWLDSLLRLEIPIVCITDAVNSFDLHHFISRAFNVWRWDSTSLRDILLGSLTPATEKKYMNCVNHDVGFEEIESQEISGAMKLLSAHSRNFASCSAKMMRLYKELSNLSFSAIRETACFSPAFINKTKDVLQECEIALEDEKKFISPERFDDCKMLISHLEKVYDVNYRLPKQKALADLLILRRFKKVYLIVPERTDKLRIDKYWADWCSKNNLCTDIEVLHPGDYYLTECEPDAVTIIACWFRRTIMRKLLFGFNSDKYIVLLYDYECRWRDYDRQKWFLAMNDTQNREIIDKSFSSDQIEFLTGDRRYFLNQPTDDTGFLYDELNEIEINLRNSSYRQYVVSTTDTPGLEITEAIPVSYVGSYFSFYKNNHKLIVITKIITENSKEIEVKTAEQLKVGDFVAVRETDLDLIKDLANIILKRRGSEDLREMAMKWKEAIRIDQLFSTQNSLFKRLKKLGCTRGYHTVSGWIADEDMIAPEQKEDLKFIGEATESDVLLERLDEIFDAAQKVRNAHRLAGKILSRQMKGRIAEFLMNCGDIDPFNIWKPIEIEIDQIGRVRILKIIDISPVVSVNVTNTNRLIEE